ncbi:hypothetical protein GGH94_006319 [Coemansia aciculifera]|uniref:4'-phosphopantetheinyl transferase domain-containing protein n=1 Tax=Coemansia aciculifera TaxID=417176 RepID=A0A9W8IKQ0_9FUNG|nr:hypothetical protein GGH94_006319 [Coemansia aciculifera]KAJ2868962.1 hypothetical protein GGH93_006304 [Coemansia aciculifera]
MTDDEYINEFSLQATDEIYYLANQSQQKLFDLYRIWTVKEAYVKAIGTGIAAIDLCQVCVELPLLESSARVRANGEFVPLNFITGTLGDNNKYAFTVATSCDVKCTVQVVDIGELRA